MAHMNVTDRRAQTQLLSSPATGGRERVPGMVEVNVTSTAGVDKALEEAIVVISETATLHRVGILVTRTGAGSYIVRAHPAVPFGLIRQHIG
jgi:hypothetical protein